MTQQPYGQPQYPAYPQQPQQQFPVPQQPAYPSQGYPQPVAPAYPPQGYPQGAPQQAPTQPLAEGSLDAFYSQPSAATGPSISWKDKAGNQKPIGTTYVGVVARDVTDADVQQQTDFNTKQPLFYADGRAKFAMKVPLRVQPSEEFPEGEATWYVKGQARDELVRAMGEAGVTGSPKAGSVISIQLTQRRQNRAGLNPSNVVQVSYQPAAATGAPSPAPVPQAAAPAAAPAPQPVAPQVPQYQQPVQQAVAPQAPPVQYAPPVQQAPAYPQQVPAPVAAPAAAGQPHLQVPGDLNPDQAALLASLTQPQQQAG